MKKMSNQTLDELAGSQYGFTSFENLLFAYRAKKFRTEDMIKFVMEAMEAHRKEWCKEEMEELASIKKEFEENKKITLLIEKARMEDNECINRLLDYAQGLVGEFPQFVGKPLDMGIIGYINYLKNKPADKTQPLMVRYPHADDTLRATEFAIQQAHAARSMNISNPVPENTPKLEYSIVKQEIDLIEVRNFYNEKEVFSFGCNYAEEFWRIYYEEKKLNQNHESKN